MTDVIGRPFKEAAVILERENIKYEIEYSRPTSSFFTVDDGNYFVIRQKKLENGRLMLTLSMKLRKEVS